MRVLVTRIGAGTGKLDLRRKSLGEGICRIGQDRNATRMREHIANEFKVFAASSYPTT